MKTKRVPNFWPRAILLLVIAPVFAEVSPTTEPSAAVSTVSTLPPALPHGNNTDPCAFSDRISLLNRIDAESNQYNVTLLVETCPNVCLLALGSGNPDISGIGVTLTRSCCGKNPHADRNQAMISYIFQGVGVFLCGPVMAIAILVFRIDLTAPSPRRPGLHNLLAKIALSINQGALFVALSIMIACVIRIRQSPPLGELSFITWLCMYQSIVGIGACVPSLLLLDFDKHRVISFNCYLCLIAVFYFTIGMMGRFSTAQRRILKQFNTHCVKKSLALFPLGEADYGNVLSAKDVIVLLLIAALCVLFGVATFFYKDQLMRVMSSIGRRFHTTPSHTVASLFVPPVAILWIFGCIYIGLSMYRSRNITRNLAGNSYQDEQWGFGQITILLLWGSVISDIILSVMGKQL